MVEMGREPVDAGNSGVGQGRLGSAGPGFAGSALLRPRIRKPRHATCWPTLFCLPSKNWYNQRDSRPGQQASTLSRATAWCDARLDRGLGSIVGRPLFLASLSLERRVVSCSRLSLIRSGTPTAF